jgi:hypothetical protein
LITLKIVNDDGEEAGELYLNDVILEVESEERATAVEVEEEIQEENQDENQDEIYDEFEEEGAERKGEAVVERGAGSIKFVIASAKILKKQDVFGEGDPYVRVLYNGEEQKTKVIKNTRKPTWDEGN